MTTSTTTPPTATSTTTSPDLARLPLRPTYLTLGVALLVLAVGLAAAWGTGVSSVLVFALLPDVALLLAVGSPGQQGRLPARAVPAYNLMHRFTTPFVLLLLAATGLLGGYWVVAAVTWCAHIAIDRGVGYGLRGADGWQRD